MSKTLQFRRGSTTLINTFAGSDGELFVDTSKATVVVMDGATLGGTPLATEYFVTAALLRASTTATLGTVKIDGTSIVISSGTISVPVASSSQTGLVRADGTSITINSSGGISITRNFTTGLSVSGTVVMSSPYTFRNRLINGNFLYWQRGTTTSTTGTYLADRWIATNISTQLQSTDTPRAEFPYSIEFGNTVATYPFIAQRLETPYAASLVSSDLTISFWAKNTSGNATLYVELAYPQTTSVYTSTMINTGLSSPMLANPPTVSSWSFYTYTWSSALLTTAFAQGLEVRIVRDNSAPSTTRVTGVQLESGGANTPFEHINPQQQLALCQRYFQVLIPKATDNGILVMRSATTSCEFPLFLPVNLRARPVISVDVTGMRLVGYDTNFNLSVVNGTAISQYTFPQGNLLDIILTHGSLAGTYVHSSVDTLSCSTDFTASAEL